jgi:hypothetical protein
MGRGKKGLSHHPCTRLQRLLKKGLQKTEALWAPLTQAYALVHRAASLLSNDGKLSAVQVRAQYEVLLREMADCQARVSSLAPALEQFRHR